MNQTTILQTKNLSEVGEDIGLAEGYKLIKAFHEANPEATKGYYIGRNILEQILAQPDCVGINFRKCLTENNQEHLVYTGVDSEQKDILTITSVSPTGNIVNDNAVVGDKTWITTDDMLAEMMEVLFGF